MPVVGEAKKTEFPMPPSGQVLSAEQLAQLRESGETPEAKVKKAADVLGGKVASETKPAEPEVPDEDKRMFVRTLLSGERFQKSYDLFGGAVKVTFHTRVVSENTRINESLKVVPEDGFGKAKEEFQFIQSLEQIDYETGKHVYGKDLVSADGFKTVELFGGMNDVLYWVLISTFRKFEALCDMLYARANEPDFWKRTDGATSRSGPTQKGS